MIETIIRKIDESTLSLLISFKEGNKIKQLLNEITSSVWDKRGSIWFFDISKYNKLCYILNTNEINFKSIMLDDTSITKISDFTAKIKIDYNLMMKNNLLFEIKHLDGSYKIKEKNSWIFNLDQTSKLCKLLEKKNIEYEIEPLLKEELLKEELLKEELLKEELLKEVLLKEVFLKEELLKEELLKEELLKEIKNKEIIHSSRKRVRINGMVRIDGLEINIEGEFDTDGDFDRKKLLKKNN